MYKRYTFGVFPPVLGTRSGIFGTLENYVTRTKCVMKKCAEKVRIKMVVFRLSRSEYEGLVKLKSKTTERSISEYLRKLALRQPVTVKYRNATADDFLRDMLQLKKELHALGNNYNQAVKKLHLLHQVPEFRNWILQYEDSSKAFLRKVNEIELKITQLYEQWLQK